VVEVLAGVNRLSCQHCRRHVKVLKRPGSGTSGSGTPSCPILRLCDSMIAALFWINARSGDALVIEKRQSFCDSRSLRSGMSHMHLSDCDFILALSNLLRSSAP
jgi:hypothetical protein